ncbi:hypothetical protein Rsub_07753 [Raphidocelis subcapitata]|uniref:Uncharacterized protein n=1 Tax=Raphidocelis subcapitata TaxID=307507 RepID=A0A2V0PE10_9CHLO|nr:hypothetical protein Rsub_07753 [Raphidocelis subcapitata]|eukprot:GBF95325.1 hypothetical protein Rsub_07753 [Raphidocelis subcapitata]
MAAPSTHLNSDGGWPALPPRHFPAFSAAGRLGGGFVCDLQPSNARHSRHLKPRLPAPPARAAQRRALGGPEALARATAEGLAEAASGFDGTAARGGATFQHVRAQPPPPPDGATCDKAAADGAADGARRAPPPALPAAVLAAVAAARGAEAARPVDFPSTNFHAALATPHSRWRHDGTDFSAGRATQRLPLRAPPWGARERAGTAGAAGAPRPATAPGARAPARRPGGTGGGASWSGGGAAAAVAGGAAGRLPRAESALAASVTWVDAAGGTAFEGQRLSQPACWFTNQSLEELRIQRDRGRAAAAAAAAAFVPRPGAAHPARSLRLRGRGGGCGAGGGLPQDGSCAVATEVAWTPAEGPGASGMGLLEAQAGAWSWTTAQAAGAPWPRAGPAFGGCPCSGGAPSPAAEATAGEAGGAEIGPETAAAIFAATGEPRWWEADPALPGAVALALTSDYYPSQQAAAAEAGGGGGAPSRTLAVLAAALAEAGAGAGGGAALAAAAAAMAGREPPLPAERAHAAWVAELAARPLAERWLQIEREAAAV